MKAVVDGQGQQRPPARSRPIGRQDQQGQGIAAARQGQGDRRIVIGGQDAVEPRADPVDQGFDGAQLQSARPRIWLARVRRAAAAASA